MRSRLILDDHDRLGQWVCDRIGGQYTEGMCIGLEQDGRLLAAVLYDGYLGRSMRMHVAAESPRWLVHREFLQVAFGYPFRQLGCEVVIGLVSSDNARAIRVDEWLGFTRHTVIPKASETGDLIVYTLYKDQCRFLEVSRGR